MELVVFTTPDKFKSEIPIVKRMFDSGLETLHLRKPKFNTSKLAEYIAGVPKKYHDRIIIHSHHKLALKYNLKGVHITRKHKKNALKLWWRLKYLKVRRPNLMVTNSCHSLSKLGQKHYNADYVLLSPVFNSISKKGYETKFTETALKSGIEKANNRVFALGGVDSSRLETLLNAGFDGAALLGYLWETNDEPSHKFLEVKNKLEELTRP